ncbi:MAG TPA: flavin reductase family protein [Holophagaceae bacterium]|nr:flavin reductase family protein [Holophagaceae bacterium]
MTDLKTLVGPALGKIPSGLAIATAQHGGERTGFLASWFQQVSFEPALVAVCVKAGRPIEKLMQGSGFFALNLVAEGDFGALKRYGKGFEPGIDPWAEDPATLLEGQPVPVFAHGYAHLVLRHVKTVDIGGDHLLHIGEVVSGALHDAEKKPYIHVRKDGFNY